MYSLISHQFDQSSNHEKFEKQQEIGTFTSQSVRKNEKNNRTHFDSYSHCRDRL